MEEQIFTRYTEALERERQTYFTLGIVACGATFFVLWFVVYLLALLLTGGWPTWAQAGVAMLLTAAQWPLFASLPPPRLPADDDWLLRWRIARREPPTWQALAWAWQLRHAWAVQDRRQRLFAGQDAAQAIFLTLWRTTEPVPAAELIHSAAAEAIIDDLLPFPPLVYHEGNPNNGFKLLGEFKAELTRGMNGNG